MIELTANDRRETFSVEHAHQLLLMRNNGGWKLPDDSEWTWSAEKGFEKKAPKAAKGSKGSNDLAGGSNGSDGQAAE